MLPAAPVLKVRQVTDARESASTLTAASMQMGQVDTGTALPIGRAVRLMCWVSADLLVLVIAGPCDDQDGAESCCDSLLSVRLRWPSQPDFESPVGTPSVAHTSRQAVHGRVLAVAGCARGEAFVHVAGGAVLHVSPLADGKAGLRGVDAHSDAARLPEDCAVLLAAHEVRGLPVDQDEACCICQSMGPGASCDYSIPLARSLGLGIQPHTVRSGEREGVCRPTRQTPRHAATSASLQPAGCTAAQRSLLSM